MNDVWLPRIEAVGKIVLALATMYIAWQGGRAVDEWKTDNEAKRVYMQAHR